MSIDTQPDDAPQPKRDGKFHHGDLKTALLAQASRVIASSGAADFSLRDLARALGVTHAATYRHFSGKADLLGALAARGWARLDELVAAAIGAAPATEAAVETLARAGEQIVAFAAVNAGAWRTMATASDTAGRAVIVKRLADVLLAGQIHGQIRSDLAAGALAETTACALDGVAMAAIRAGQGRDGASQRLRQLADILREGLKPADRAGREAAPAEVPVVVPESRRERRKEPAPQMQMLDLFG